MDISDWSSDLGSSDLRSHPEPGYRRCQLHGGLVGTQQLSRYRQCRCALRRRPVARSVRSVSAVEEYRRIGPRSDAVCEERDQQNRIPAVGLGLFFDRLCGLRRSEEHTSELQSLMRTSYAVFCLKKKKLIRKNENIHQTQVVMT